MTPPITPGAVRPTILDALDYANALGDLPKSAVRAFVEEHGDITLAELELNSLARMELLIALEVEHGVSVLPDELAGFSSLGELAQCVAARTQTAKPPTLGETVIAVDDTASPANHPQSVRLYRRGLRLSRTANQLNKLHISLENRLTPPELEEIRTWARQPSPTGAELHPDTKAWLERLDALDAQSPREAPAPFRACRVAPGIRHCVGPGERWDKSLLLCFTTRASRMMMPLPVFLQYIDPLRFDLLIIADGHRTSFEGGAPHLGTTLDEVINTVGELAVLRDYASLRTLGCSGGGYPAIVAAQQLGAELGVSVGGRFEHGQRLARWRKVRRTRTGTSGRGTTLLLIYGAEKTRDQKFATAIARASGATRMPLQVADDELGHLVLDKLRARGELKALLDATICQPAPGPSPIR
mgnify:FL=1